MTWKQIFAWIKRFEQLTPGLGKEDSLISKEAYPLHFSEKNGLVAGRRETGSKLRRNLLPHADRDYGPVEQKSHALDADVPAHNLAAQMAKGLGDLPAAHLVLVIGSTNTRELAHGKRPAFPCRHPADTGVQYKETLGGGSQFDVDFHIRKTRASRV